MLAVFQNMYFQVKRGRLLFNYTSNTEAKLLDAHCAVPELPFRQDKHDSWISFPRKCKNGIFTEIVTKEMTDPFV